MVESTMSGNGEETIPRLVLGGNPINISRRIFFRIISSTDKSSGRRGLSGAPRHHREPALALILLTLQKFCKRRDTALYILNGLWHYTTGSGQYYVLLPTIHLVRTCVTSDHRHEAVNPKPRNSDMANVSLQNRSIL